MQLFELPFLLNLESLFGKKTHLTQTLSVTTTWIRVYRNKYKEGVTMTTQARKFGNRETQIETKFTQQHSKETQLCQSHYKNSIQSLKRPQRKTQHNTAQSSYLGTFRE